MPFKVFKQHGLDFQKLAVTVLEQGKACNTRTSVHNIEPTALFWKALQMGNDCHGIWAKLCMTNAIHALLWFFSLYGVVWEVSGYETVLLREIWSSLPSNQHLKSRFSIHYMFMWHIAWSTWNLEAPGSLEGIPLMLMSTPWKVSSGREEFYELFIEWLFTRLLWGQ